MSQLDNIIKEIPDYEGLYGATSDGRIFSYRSNKFLKPWLNFYGRPMINASVKCKKRWEFVHRLVYKAWHGPIPEGLDVDHINGDKVDNRASNLRVLTRSENMKSHYRLQRLTKQGRYKTINSEVSK